ncbi:alpha-L-rhamnosidase C-terminal domain-containing protein [Pelagicoccus sp. SDUM812002]|uniref:alpha-L-rhamnosidase-related protein n=1 Tax=Pelagicoccus sp. SDUM812002 TaxID=3041266 RepID=UPI00280EF865|nr:alpha-L-rhamnosidase C-terminal domain-containing protein [Pelagicoccus sp. SDUM812002]MDQ8184384.1 alpha-L-rhamnosidase C-terminal domain-containing protein [Pelagicoccus sp. SDUM812002]
MNRKFSAFLAYLILTICVATAGASINPELLKNVWPARWIGAADRSNLDYGVYHYRKSFELSDVPETFLVHVSADCRYKLYVNGEQVSQGPAAGDLFHWNFESVDLAPYLENGTNQIASLVWNEGEGRPQYQISFRTGFILQGDSEAESVLNTNVSWKAIRSTAFGAVKGIGHDAYYVSGPGEQRDFRTYVSGWEFGDFDDSDWPFAVELPVGWPVGGKPKGARAGSEWNLVPRVIPPLEMKTQRFDSFRKAEGISADKAWLDGEKALRVEPESKVRILLDNGVLTNAYPILEFSEGRNARIELVYAESLFEEIPEDDPPLKGNRNVIEGKTIAGRKDRIISSGETGQLFEPLSWRTFRYVQLEIETADEALILDDIRSVFVGYPFELKSTFEAGGQQLAQILEIGWRTARLCAVEIYMDCPYYEQLQYIGDTRIQALVSLYNSGDDRLVKNALNLMDQSRIAEGITMSRHPSRTPQIISTFSLWYIGMLHDYWMYGSDEDFVREKLDGVRSVLKFFSDHQGADGRLTDVPYWTFTDWVEGTDSWDSGEAPIGSEGESAILDLTLLWAFQLASEMEEKLGSAARAGQYAGEATRLGQAIRENYYDASRNLVFDTKDRSKLSQHANSLAILTGILSSEESRALAPVLLEGADMSEASIYFKYYLHLALKRAGYGDDYLSWLDKWRENIDMGLTTWAEKSEVATSRSDCHAWGSSPNIELFRILLGIDSVAPGWKKVRVEPHLGELKEASGSIPHPLGTLSVSYREVNGLWVVRIELPNSVTGDFVWKGQSFPLNEGVNELRL